jgi:hypothetical protein
MAHPVSLTIVAAVRPGRAADVERVLEAMGDGVANAEAVAFAALSGVHFARFLLVDEATDLAGAPLPASLLYMSDLDVSQARHVAELVDTSSPQLDRLLEHCDGYPDGTSRTRDTRIAYLRDHVVREQARYVNTVGRTVARCTPMPGCGTPSRPISTAAARWPTTRSSRGRGCAPTSATTPPSQGSESGRRGPTSGSGCASSSTASASRSSCSS